MAQAPASLPDLLPTNVVPSHYSLHLHDLSLSANVTTYSGTVEIQATIQEETRTVVLNSHCLELQAASIRTLDGREVPASNITIQESKQRCELHFPESLLPSGPRITITISFRGQIDDDLSGFFRFQQPSDQGLHYVAATQFQPSDARRAFPCFDEPALKATFDLSIEIESGLQVISNMPVEKIEPARGRVGLSVIHFQRTPKMSTYLLAWAIGQFEFAETTLTRRDAQPLPIRVYCPPGQKPDAKFALNIARRSIGYFSEIFGIDYPLPKLDLIALLELSDDAMENWGLVTFRSTALLVNPATTDLATTTRAAYIIAHELAHQWFGNLVTMRWWDDLWLNEGFATWAGWAACDKFFPEWDVWGMFLVDDMQEALDLDTLPSSHPVQVPVSDGLEVDSIFDSISYLKGAAIVRMLAGLVGEELFLKGVSSYLKSNAYGNSTADDLWQHLSKASQRDIGSLMKPWIDRKGYPLVGITETLESTVLVSQKNEDTLWRIPLQIETTTGSSHDILEGKTITYGCSTKINVDQVGFFRTRYSKTYLEKLTTDLENLSPHNQAGILCNELALAWRGDGTCTDEVLELLNRFSGSTDAIVWDSISLVLSQIQSIFSDDAEISEYLDTFTCQLAEPLLDRLGWSFHKHDDHNTNRLRVLLVELLGLSGSQATVQRACQEGKKWLKEGDADAIHPFLLQPVLEIAVQSLCSEIMDDLWKVYQANESPILRDQIATAFGQIQDPQTARAVLSKAFDGDMATQDIQTLAISMAGDVQGREYLWTFFSEEWDKVEEEMGGSMAIFNPLIGETLRHFATEEARKRIVDFFEDKDTRGYSRGLAVAVDFISANAAYRKRNVEGVRVWLNRRMTESDRQ